MFPRNNFCLLIFIGFFTTVFSYICKDDVHKDCEERVARGGCIGEGGSYSPYTEARLTLAECRQSCRDLYHGVADEHLPHMIKLYGGLEDYVVDGFGFKYDLCSPNKGFTSQGRVDVLFHCAAYNMTLDWVPSFTKVGFEKTIIPTDLYKDIIAEYDELKKSMVVEGCHPGVINCQTIEESEDKCYTSDNRRTFLMLLSPYLLETIKATMLPLAETWSGVKLEHTSTYGIRRYTDGSWLVSHIDKFTTHVISAIFNIGQSVRRDWDLHIMDNDGHGHQVVLQPGEMVWYESARLLHGRPQLLEGEYFDNLFIHYKPTHLWYQQQVENPRLNPLTLDEIKRVQNSKREL